MPRTRTTLIIVLVLVAVTVSASGSQERAPNGQIYGELKPFVGLEGVRFELQGIGGTIFNVPPGKGDPQTEVTGMNRAQTDELNRSIHADAAEAFRAAGIPVLSRRADGPDTQPRLVVNAGWYHATPELFAVQVEIHLMEAARLIKDPDKIVWTSSWQEVFKTTASRRTLARTVQSTVKGEVLWFIGLYKRAHAKTD